MSLSGLAYFAMTTEHHEVRQVSFVFREISRSLTLSQNPYGARTHDIDLEYKKP